MHRARAYGDVVMEAETRGKTLAAARIRALAPEIERARLRLGRPPTLGVVATGDTTNRRFVAIKQEAFERAGAVLQPEFLAAGADTNSVRDVVTRLGRAAGVDGIFVQFPLPAAVDGQACADAIEPGKDVDAASAASLGRLLAGQPQFLPAAPAAVLELLSDGVGELLQRTVIVVGADGVVARAILLLCVARGAICGITAPDDPALPDQLAGVDAAVFTDALPPRDALRLVRSGAVLLDAAYYLPRRPDHWLQDRTRSQLGAFLPQYGNVGPLTVALLMEATVRAALAPTRAR